MNTQDGNPFDIGEENTMQNEEIIPENEAISEDPSSPEEPSSEINESDTWKKKFEEMNDKYLRLYSEFDNFRKRSSREQIELRKTAASDIFAAILPVVDDFDRASKAIEFATDIEVVKEGMQLIQNKLWSILSSKGLDVMDPTEQDFDPEIHEAITSIPSPDESMKGKVIDVLEKGYSLNGKVIRFAKVVVGG